MAAESLTRSSAINLINGSIDSFMFSHACYCTSNMESLSEDDLELYDQMHEVISILNDDEDYRHDLETMPLEDLKEFLLMCRKMADNNNLSLKSEFPQGNFEIVEDEKTETELNPDKIENEKSFWNTLWGALQGEYNENPTGTEILIDMGLNFIPFVGQACDVRDITACLKKLVIEKRVNEIMIWVTLLLTAIGCVPYAGDVVKAGCKAIIKGADDIVLKILRRLDADDVQKAFKMLKTKFTSSIDDAIAMVNKWIKEAGNSKYGSKINEVLTGANGNLRKASDFVNNKIDEFGEKIFGNGKKSKISVLIHSDKTTLKNIDDFTVGKKSFDDVVEDYSKLYADKVNTNIDWSWDKSVPNGQNLSIKQKRQIKQKAIDNGYIQEIKVTKAEGLKYGIADFDSAGIVKEIEYLPESMWKMSDKKQFEWLDEKIGGHVEGYTWHHTEEPGKMQLVPKGLHNITNHNGGRSEGMWADAPR